ncbi:MAG: J domain-containing protein [Treponema sp.]|nr:J domain-containing protein [Treponema sp.]
MQTMYDKLGELLSETLEAGEIKFVRVERPQRNQPESTKDAESTESAKATKDAEADSGAYGRENSEEKTQEAKADSSAGKTTSQQKGSGTQNRRRSTSSSGPKKKPVANNSYFYKKITPELERAYRLLDINFQSSLDDAKKAYKEKLKYYHPDRYAGNEVLTKVATDKTRQIVESFNMISEFLTK